LGDLLDVVVVDMAVTAGPDELPDAETERVIAPRSTLAVR